MSRLAAGDRSALGAVTAILGRLGGEPFARAVAARLGEGVPPQMFGFLPCEGGPAPQWTTRSATAPVPLAAAPQERPAPTRALPTDGYISVAEVARHFGVSTKAVYRWMAAGKIQSERRPGGSYRIPAAQFRDPR